MLKIVNQSSNQVLREVLGNEINTLREQLKPYPKDSWELKNHADYSTFCEISRKYYSKLRELEFLNDNDPVFQAELKKLNTKAIQSFSKDHRFSITE